MRRGARPGPSDSRSEWGKNLYDLRPLYPERRGLTKVGPLPAPPPETKGFAEYVFDARGRLAEVRRHVAKGRVDVDKVHHGPDSIAVEHRPGVKGAPKTKSRYELSGGRPVSWTWDTLAGRVEERYEYEGDRLRFVRATGPNDPPTLFTIEWSDGELRSITSQVPGGRPVEVYRAERGSTDGVGDIERDLLAAIVSRVGALKLEEPVYGLLLVDPGGYDAIPPELALGLARERDAWLDRGAEVAELLWSPEDLTYSDDERLRLEDPALLERCRDLKAGARRDGSPSPLRQVLVRIAKRLNADPRLLDIPQTKDFVVLVVGLDGSVRAAELDECVPAKRLATLRKRRWLPTSR